jgi:hypothetical protein
MKRTKKRKKEDVDTSIIYTTKEAMIDTKKSKLNDILSSRIVISHATIDKAKVKVEEI